MMYEDVLEHYKLLLRCHPLELSACWTVVRGAAQKMSVNECVRRLGRDESALELLTLADWLEFDRSALFFVESEAAVMVVEPMGAILSSSSAMGTLSIGGEVWSVSWNENLAAQLNYARDGGLLAAYDFLYETRAGGAEPEIFDPYRDFLSEHVRTPDEGNLQYENSLITWWAAGMAVVELASGVRLGSASLESPLPALVFEDEF
ncbi:hypothetical protein [Microbispora sp. NPDC046933]|uniref:DUF6461 domain-containing protein n=1 Tax=Microbispora sp. NPDC046933 TaxID=3155618 RepID=UPI0033D6D78A